MLSSAEYGVQTICFSQLILAAGCREIPAGALDIAGTRPMGVYTAGQMQEMINVYGMLPQSPVVILGSGDIGLIMAKQIAEIGGKVALVEQNSVLGGLERIGFSAFDGTSISEFTLPNSVTAVDDSAFWNCHNLQTHRPCPSNV